ncbi:AMP-dependent synthetase/ligase [Robiginitomaculum antarcticum]|uniref:AMP-dependent synthetase/ligase n=1 Tax=Robiginitomaculum antarcticum TaxID=437507 RepID=UPI0003725868|nr:long-chain fatty acid--CoA ligase [Robiginitomaculum antarcticum]
MTLTMTSGPKTPPLPGTTVLDLIALQAENRGDRDAYYAHNGSDWQAVSWAQHYDDITRAARALMAGGFQSGQVVCIIGDNTPEWVTMDLAAMMAGGMSAGIYQTSSPEEIAYILNHSEAPVIVAQNAHYLAQLAEIFDQCPHLTQIVMMDGAPADHPSAETWDAFLARAAEVPDDALRARIAAIHPDDIGGLIYTSGTTGPPKAVALSHKCIHGISGNANAFLDIQDGEVLLSYLPLSHIAEKALSIYGPAGGPHVIYFSRGMDKLAEDIAQSRPHILFGVPRVWEKIQAALSLKFASAEPKKQASLKKAMDTGKAWFVHQRAGTKPGIGLKVKYALYDKLAYSKIQAALGLDRVRVCISGAAAIAKDTPLFFNGIGLQIGNVYGLSETGGGASCDLPMHRVKIGSVGPAVPNFDIKIADDEEIWLRGNTIFTQYLKDPEATAAVLKDGWFATGDLGYIDDDGYLFISGRKKDLIITSGGKNIAPSNLETAMMSIPYIEHAIAVGDGFNFISALITLDVEACARSLDVKADYAELAKSARLRDSIRGAIEQMNDKFARVESVREFRILPKPLSIEDGFLTPTMKVKRAKVITAYNDKIEDIYGVKDS